MSIRSLITKPQHGEMIASAVGPSTSLCDLEAARHKYVADQMLVDRISTQSRDARCGQWPTQHQHGDNRGNTVATSPLSCDWGAALWGDCVALS